MEEAEQEEEEALVSAYPSIFSLRSHSQLSPLNPWNSLCRSCFFSLASDVKLFVVNATFSPPALSYSTPAPMVLPFCRHSLDLPLLLPADTLASNHFISLHLLTSSLHRSVGSYLYIIQLSLFICHFLSPYRLSLCHFKSLHRLPSSPIIVLCHITLNLSHYLIISLCE